MMNPVRLAGAAVLLAGSLGLASAASAAPAASAGIGSPDLPVTHVAGGCGPGWHRGPYGGCRPGGYRRGFYGPRPGFYGRRCFVRPTPFGPRRVCRW